MFDLFRSRQKAVRYMLGGILMVIAVTMVITLIPGLGQQNPGRQDDPVIAQVCSNKITASQVIYSAARFLDARNAPPEMLQAYLPTFIDQMVQQRALGCEFEKLGVTATDDEVYNSIALSFPQFFQNGQLTNKAQFEAYVAQQGQTIDEFIDDMRGFLVANKVSNIEYSAAVVTPKEIDEAVGQKFDKAKVKYIAFPGSKFMSEVKVSPDELKPYFDARRANYAIPEKRSFSVLVLEQDKVAQSIQVSDAQLQAAYRSNLSNFQTPDRVHVRHILIMTQGKPDADKKALLAKAQDVLKQVKAGGDFAALAAKYSDDTSNKDKGGDLGWVVHGQMVAEFEKGAFALQKGQISDIVTSQFGYHIIQCLEKESARTKPFDEVKGSIAEDLRRQAVTDKMQTLGDQMQAALSKAPGNAAEIAKQFGAEVVNVTDSERGSPVPTLGASPEIDNALSAMKKNDVSQVLTLPANREAVVILTDKKPARPAELSEVEAKVREAIQKEKADALAVEKAKDAAGKIRGGEDMAKVAKSYGLSVTESIEFTHADSVEGLGSAAQIPDAFTKPVGSVVGPINDDPSHPVAGVPQNVVYQIVDQTHVDPSKLANERTLVAQDLKRAKGSAEAQLLMDSVFSQMVAKGEVKIHKDAVKQLIAGLRR